MPDMEKLATEYKKSRTVLVAHIDCAGKGQATCGKFGVQGFPSLKAFKFKDGKKTPDDFNGGRDYNSIKKYIDANLAGPECSLEDKEGCEPAERAILEESEKMSVADRRTKVTAMEEDVKTKKNEAKQLEKEVKELTKTLDLFKLGGQKPDRVMQLVNDAEFRENCEHRTCVVSFLPHILDGGAAARNDFLKTVEAAFKKSKGDNPGLVGFMWSQGGDQFDAEEKMNLQFGFPAVIAINVKKERFGVHRGKFDKESLSAFLSSMMVGRVPLQPVPKGLKWGKSDPWDGKDGEMPVEEDL